MRTAILTITTIACALGLSSVAHADINGRTGASTAGCGSAVSCHGAQNTATTVQIMGSTSVMVGSMNTFRLIINNMAMSQTAAGLDIAASGGTLGTNAMATQTRLSRGEITHSSPIARGASGWSIPFNWTAPMNAGVVRITAAGNAVNGNGRTSGDQWNTTTFTVMVTNSMMADSGVATDSGIAPRDSGVPVDSGVAMPDSGVAVDSGVAPMDDAAAPQPDASAPPPSDGSTARDAGGTPADGGTGMQMPGCACRTTPARTDPKLALFTVAALGLWARSRRRRAAI